VGDAGELIADGPGDFRVPVTMDICPDRRISVDVFSAAAVPQDRPFSFDQNERLMPFRAPLHHLGERMPAMGLVQSGQGFRVPNVSHRGAKYLIPSCT
jgi:hypothetical protein